MKTYQTPAQPQMRRLAAVARDVFGMSPEALEGACRRGELPIRVERIGKLKMVRTAEVSAYMESQQGTAK